MVGVLGCETLKAQKAHFVGESRESTISQSLGGRVLDCQVIMDVLLIWLGF